MPKTIRELFDEKLNFVINNFDMYTVKDASFEFIFLNDDEDKPAARPMFAYIECPLYRDQILVQYEYSDSTCTATQITLTIKNPIEMRLVFNPARYSTAIDFIIKLNPKILQIRDRKYRKYISFE